MTDVSGIHGADTAGILMSAFPGFAEFEIGQQLPVCVLLKMRPVVGRSARVCGCVI